MTCLLNYNIAIFAQRNGSSVLHVVCTSVTGRYTFLTPHPNPHLSQTHVRTHNNRLYSVSSAVSSTHTHAHIPLYTISCALTKLHFTLLIRLPREKVCSTLNRSSDSECTHNMVPPRLRCPMVTFLLTDTSFKLNGERGGT